MPPVRPGGSNRAGGPRWLKYFLSPLPRLLALCTLISWTGCTAGITDLNDQRPPRDTVVLGFGDSTRIISLSGADGRFLDRRVVEPSGEVTSGNDVEDGIGGSAVDRADRVLITAVFGTRPTRELAAYCFPGFEVRWQEPIPDIAARLSTANHLEISGSRIELGPGGQRIVMNAAIANGPELEDFGVVVLERNRRQPVGFIGGFAAGDIPTNFDIVEEPGESDDLLVLGGVRKDGVARTMIYGLKDLSLRDSVSKGPVLGLGDDLRSARDGRHFFFLTGDSIFKADARRAEIVLRRSRARAGVISEIGVTTNPVRLFLSDWGTATQAGSGELQVYDGNLNDLGTVNLRFPLIGQDGVVVVRTPAMRGGIAVNEEEDRLFVASGTSSIGLGGFTQPGAVSVVDVESLARVATHRVGGYSLNIIHAF